MKLPRLTACVIFLGLLQGCISTKQYVDTQFHHAEYGDLVRVNPPYNLAVKVEFQRNGASYPKADRPMLDRITRSLRASGVVVPYEGKGTAEGELSVIVNDTGNVGAAAAKGFGTGLTFGLVGSTLADNDQITVRLTQADVSVERDYQHAIITTVGNASGPPGLTPAPRGTAGNQITDDVVLNFLKDMQTQGRLLPRSTSP